MTRLERSESQLNAEAADQTSLEDMIGLHRAMYHVDLWVEKMVTDTPPVFTDSQTGKRSADLMSQLGPTLSGELVAYLTGSNPRMKPWVSALFALRWECRKHHPEHQERPEFRGSLCHRLVLLTVCHEHILDRACLKLGTTPERSGRVLRHALKWIESHIDWQRAKQEQQAKIDAGTSHWPPPPEHVHRPLPGLHQEECPQCRKRNAA